MNNLIKRVWTRKELVFVEDLRGMAFTNEDGAHTFSIAGKDENGADLALSGTVAGSLIRPDGTTTAMTGTIADGCANLTLSPECYGVSGRASLTIFLTSGGQKTAIYHAVMSIGKSSTSQVSPGVAADVVDLVNRIDTATASIPATYTALLGSIASDYSSSKTYKAGNYVWYGGYLYKAKQDIDTAESWTSGHWTKVVLADDFRSEITSLKSALNDIPISVYNVFANYDTVYRGKIWSSQTGMSMTDSSGFDIYRTVINDTTKYYLVKPSGTAYSNSVRFADASNAYLSIASGLNTLNTPPSGTYYLYFRVPAGEMPIAIAEDDLANYNAGYRSELSDTVYIRKIGEMADSVNTMQDKLSGMITPSVNLADPSKFTRNKYMDASGNTGSSSSYFYTGKIAVSAGDVLYYKSNDIRYVTSFNDNTVVPWSGGISSPLTIPSGITGIVFTGYMARIDSFMISKINVTYQPYGETIKSEYLQIDNKNALNGNNGISIIADTLAEDTTLEITDYPQIIAAHDRLSGYCKFSSVGEIFFGYGYGNNKYCGVDATNINIYIDGTLSTSIPHGIAISDYLVFSIIMDDDRIGQITINSTGGTATATISLSYRKSGLPFIRSTTALTGVKLSAICKDIKNPIWWFGDSYSSLAPERIIGQLDNYGVIGNMLIDAVPGGRSYFNETSGGYIEFLKLTRLAKPKYVIWALGMNDTDANYNVYLTLVKNYCDINGISLYAVKIPSVPNIDNTAKNSYVDTLGINAIDWATAVNATAQGVWYNGYLSSDNVHPTVAGAQAMAARTIVDCPAIMQF